MGYTTEFQGKFTVNKPVDDKTYNLLVGLTKTRRMKRAGLDAKYGIEGEFFCEDTDNFGQGDKPSLGSIVDHNVPPRTQPGLWCQWEIQKDRVTIEHDGGEKFYHYVEWIKYLIDKVLAPAEYVVNGAVDWRGENFGDDGTIKVVNNKVTIH